MRAVYVDGLQNVLDRLSPLVTRLVYASSTGVFGQTGGEWVDETSATCPLHESGQVCLEAEGRIEAWGQARSPVVATVILRYAGLYGPGRIVRRAALERGEAITGDPEKFLNMIHIDDAAGAALAALRAPQAEPMYVVSDDRPVTRLEYYSRMASLVGAPVPRFQTPAPGSPESARDATNKRISNRRIKSGLALRLIYPDITTGLAACLDVPSRSE
jgi:nucleoside-diphosphate-sugar epimerase